MRISIVGTGYVGLVSGVCLAAKGHDVTCVDIDPVKVDRINRGDAPIHEKGLSELLGDHVGRNFRATTDLAKAVGESRLTMIAVGTPFDGEEIDLEFIRGAAGMIGGALAGKSDYHVVLVKSTVVPGTTDEVVTPILEETSGKTAGRDFGVGMNPEFLREGEAVGDFMNPDRIVMGGIDERTLGVIGELYEPFAGVEKLLTNPRTAETIKYTANSLLATMISFSNEIGNLCAAIGNVDVCEVMRGVHLDKRLSTLMPDGTRVVPAFTTYLEAGCGFGGSCFPKDVKALVAHGRKAGLPMRVLDSVIRVNERQPREMLGMLRKHFPDLAGVRVAVLGLAFKPGTDDMRESPAIPIVKDLLFAGAEVVVFDPVAHREAGKLLAPGAVRFADSLEDAVTRVEAVLLLTRWEEFGRLPALIAQMPDPPLLVDGRRMIGRHEVPRYEGIGLSLRDRDAGGPAGSQRRANDEETGGSVEHGNRA